MEKKLINSGSKFEEQIAYSRAVVQGNWVFVSGTTGYNYESMAISDDIVEQTKQCFVNIKHALEKAGASLSDIVRITYILPNADDFEQCWPILRKYLGNVKPAATMLSAGLINKAVKIEIEVTAFKNS